jgi:hypothetical protein
MEVKNQDRQTIQKAQRTDNPMPRLMPLKKAAEYIGLTTWGLREAVWRGDIPVVTFPGGRKQFIDTKDIEAFIQRNKRLIS